MSEELRIKIINSEPIPKLDTDLEKEDKPTLEELLALPHPLEQEQNADIRELIEHYFPEKNYLEQLIAATQPSISNNPDELEKWEAHAILLRKQRTPNDFGIAYLLRLLYEETFSVCQFQGEKFNSEGFTPGGLVSHHYLNKKINGISIDTIPELDLIEDSLQAEFERLISIEDSQQLEKLVTLVIEIGLPERYHLESYIAGIRRNLLSTQKYTAIPTLESRGFRTIQLLKKCPELLKPIEDETLLAIFDIKIPRNVSFLVYRLWGMFANSPGPFFLEGGYYRTEPTEHLIRSLEKLIQFRIHPETQALYEYLSPAGYVNQTSSDE